MNVAIKLHLLIFCGHLDDALFEILTYKDPAIGLYKAVLFGMAERQVVFDGCLGSRRRITGGRKELWMSKRLHHPPRGFCGATGWSCKLFAKKVPGKPRFGSGSFSLWGIGAQPFSQITGSLCARPSQKGARAESKICKKHENGKKWLAGFRYPKSSVHQSALHRETSRKWFVFWSPAVCSLFHVFSRRAALQDGREEKSRVLAWRVARTWPKQEWGVKRPKLTF